MMLKQKIATMILAIATAPISFGQVAQKPTHPPRVDNCGREGCNPQGDHRGGNNDRNDRDRRDRDERDRDDRDRRDRDERDRRDRDERDRRDRDQNRGQRPPRPTPYPTPYPAPYPNPNPNPNPNPYPGDYGYEQTIDIPLSQSFYSPGQIDIGRLMNMYQYQGAQLISLTVNGSTMGSPYGRVDILLNGYTQGSLTYTQYYQQQPFPLRGPNTIGRDLGSIVLSVGSGMHIERVTLRVVRSRH